MPKRIPALTDIIISDAKPQSKMYKLHDGFGLYLVVTPNGSKSWRVSYSFEGRREYLVLGKYPQYSLEDARGLNATIREQIKSGINPIQQRKEEVVIENEKRHSTENGIRVSINMNGIIEIWRGRDVVRLARDEAMFVKAQLDLLL